MSDSVECCFCVAALVVKTRANHDTIVRSWECPQCGLEIKDEEDVTLEQARQVMHSLNS